MKISVEFLISHDRFGFNRSNSPYFNITKRILIIKTTSIFLARHGETEWNLEERLQGNKNSPLTENGIDQAKKAGEILANSEIGIVYSSPLKRAVNTARLILDGKNTELIIRDGLREIHLGPWEGKTKKETEISHPEEYINFWYYPDRYHLKGGETYRDLQKRVVEEIQNIFDENRGKTILVVSHWIAIKTAIAFFLGKPLKKLNDTANLSNGSILQLSMIDGKVKVSASPLC